jgi:hydrogenase/urease accessory protein HupE
VPSRFSLRRFACLSISWLVLSAPEAWAHTAIDGIDTFYNGVLHPFVVPSHLLGLIALGLLTGQQGPDRVQWALPVFLIPLALALVFTGLGGVAGAESALLLWALLCGALVALKPLLPPWVLWGCLVGEGVLVGLDSVPMGLEGKDRWALLFGIFLGAGLLLLYLALIVQRLNRPWQQVGVRVLGSWIIASSLLVLTLSLTPSP